LSEATENRLEEDEEHIKLGRRIREAREYLGLSQEFVADQLGIPRASVSAIETGKRKVGSLELKELARLLRRPVSYFLGEGADEVEGEETFRALYRTARSLSEQDREQVLRFAQFLRHAGKMPLRETK
jgi:transcriptional regulator with XRE-family HTH domain